MTLSFAMKRFDDHFAGCSSSYRRSRPSYPPDLVAWLAKLPGGNSLAWDAGCGSGQMSLPLASAFDLVVASDASASQIAAAPRHPGVRYRVARSEMSGIPSGAVDLAVSAQAVHWFDVSRYYQEVTRVLRPAGGIALVCYGQPELSGTSQAVVQQFHRETLKPYWPAARSLVEDKYRSLPFPFVEVRAPDFVMRDDWDFRRFVAYVQTWTAVRQLIHSAGSVPLERFLDRLGESWGDPHSTREIRWPVAVRAGHRATT